MLPLVAPIVLFGCVETAHALLVFLARRRGRQCVTAAAIHAVHAAWLAVGARFVVQTYSEPDAFWDMPLASNVKLALLSSTFHALNAIAGRFVEYHEERDPVASLVLALFYAYVVASKSMFVPATAAFAWEFLARVRPLGLWWIQEACGG